MRNDEKQSSGHDVGTFQVIGMIHETDTLRGD